MRIISGKHKGRRIIAPKRLPVRPTTDMAKEALFNILHNSYYLEELRVLDLFAGTGNISFEFASRGAAKITSVDADYGCTKFIAATAKALEMEIDVVNSDVFKYLEKTRATFNIIFADPPYDMALERFAELPKLVFQSGILQEEGQLIIEHSKHSNLSQLDNFVAQRKYGGSVFSFFEQLS